METPDTPAAALHAIARALHQLGNADAATPQGALEAHGGAILQGTQLIADALHDVADALRERGGA
jgi:hypothetical protein